MNQERPVADVIDCNHEQMHLIGGVQPHGALIGASLSSGRITHVSANTAELLGKAPAELLGAPVDTVLNRQGLDVLTDERRAEGTRAVLGQQHLTFGLSGGRFDCLGHRRADCVMLEYCPAPPVPTDPLEHDELRRDVISQLTQPQTLPELAQLAAGIVRRINGFDRVMVYRFAEDDHGEVIAEETNRPESYMGLHYPASDVPEPARQHFRLNGVRAIADVRAAPSPLISQGEMPLDLTYVTLRAVPDTHLQYLSNMGVAASTSIALVNDDRLWGLIACHNYTPRQVSVETLRFSELLAGTIAALLAGIENRAQLSRAIEAERRAFSMEQEGRSGRPLAEVVADAALDLMGMLGAQGLVFRQNAALTRIGATPPDEISLAALQAASSEGIAVTDRMADLAALTPEQARMAAGVAYIELSYDGGDHLVLLREEHARVVSWAGKPETAVEERGDGTRRLTPRASFALWRDERRGLSRPFVPTDFEVLRILRRALFAINSQERERAAIAARKDAEAEEERLRLVLLDAARTNSMGELASALAHELNQPLAAVANYVNACRQQILTFDANLPDGFEALMLDAVSEASRAADLVRRLRDFIGGGQLRFEHSDLSLAIRQGAELALLAHGTHRPELVLDMPDDLPEMWIDQIQIGQVILNLAMNAAAAMAGHTPRILTIRVRIEAGFVVVSVEDTGPGIPVEIRPVIFEPFHTNTHGGMGIGLSLCRSIVLAHGGQIEAPVTRFGGCVVFTLPIRKST